jgi:hypothetical protein
MKFISTNFFEPVAAQVKMDIPAAKSVKPNLRTLVYFELVAPYTESEVTRKEPTFSSPLEANNVTVKYLAKPIEIWFFDQITGKVFFKKKL